MSVYGLWHLGCTLSASWSKLGHAVVGIDPDEKLIAQLQSGKAPLFEPGLNELIQENQRKNRLRFSTQASDAKGSSVIFVAYDTPIDDEDRSHLKLIEKAIESLIPHMDEDAVIVMSAQLPVGASRKLRSKIQKRKPRVELAYSPENLRLGEALACYLKPGHVVIGTETPKTGEFLKELFAPMEATVFQVNLPTAEMTKHGINSFLANSITLANQLADLCDQTGANVTQIIEVMRRDPRIGSRAYLAPGFGFSGGTLGRDLRVLESVSRKSSIKAPLFGALWKWNQERYKIVRKKLDFLGKKWEGKKMGVLGLTYKPGTSTLRRSLPLKIALDLQKSGASIQVYDPKADYDEAKETRKFKKCSSVAEAAEKADALVVLTAWPEFREVSWKTIPSVMNQPIILDPSNFLHHLTLDQYGFKYIGLGL